MPLIEARDISKRYGRRPVLTGVSFTVGRGEIVGVVGENGSGKTTLLNIVAGITAADQGMVRTTGRWGYCPQEMVLHDLLTLDEHFRYYGAAYGLTPQECRRQRDALASYFGFAGYLDYPAATVSGGTKQKLSLSLSALHQPDLLILDEPYAHFDWDTYLKFWAFARDLARTDRSVLIVSHFFYEPTDVDRLFVLRDGTLKCQTA